MNHENAAVVCARAAHMLQQICNALDLDPDATRIKLNAVANDGTKRTLTAYSVADMIVDLEQLADQHRRA